jgi:predicted nucleic-acid-binding protein
MNAEKTALFIKELRELFIKHDVSIDTFANYAGDEDTFCGTDFSIESNKRIEGALDIYIELKGDFLDQLYTATT